MAEGSQNIMAVIEEQNLGAVGILDEFVYFKRDEGEKIIEIFDGGQRVRNCQDPIAVKRYSKNLTPEVMEIEGEEMKFLPVNWRWVVRGDIEKNLLYEIQYKNQDGEIVWKKLYSPAYGLYATSLWSPGQEIEVRRNFWVPSWLDKGRYSLEIELVEANLSPLRDVTGNLRLEQDIQRFGQAIYLGHVEIN